MTSIIGNVVPVATNRSCVDWFWCTQFVVLFAPIFSKILNYDFKEGDTADGVLSHIADSPQVMYPPISTQKDFGYSDIIQRQPIFSLKKELGIAKVICKPPVLVPKTAQKSSLSKIEETTRM